MKVSSSPPRPIFITKQANRFHAFVVPLFVIALTFLATAPHRVVAQQPDTVVARVGNHAITQQEVDDTAANQVFALQQQLFAIRTAALNNLIASRLLEDEARRQHLSVEELKNKWMSGPVVVQTNQVEDLYTKNLSAFGLMSADEAKTKVRLDLEAQLRIQKYREELNALRERNRVTVLLEEPQLRVERSAGKLFSNGPDQARLVIVEFSDFQCPYCKEVQSTLKRIMESYPNEVRLEFKFLPLDIHPLAFTAARAAYCGGQQGAFWNFHDSLFEASDLSPSGLRNIANALNLKPADFERCLSSPQSHSSVMADVYEARRLGINGTPSFVINGKLMRGLTSFEQFRDVITRELTRPQSETSTQK